MTFTIKDVLSAYGEWLDGQSLIRGDNRPQMLVSTARALVEKKIPFGDAIVHTINEEQADALAEQIVGEVDARTHDDLAEDFIKWWGSDKGRPSLPGLSPEDRRELALRTLTDLLDSPDQETAFKAAREILSREGDE